MKKLIIIIAILMIGVSFSQGKFTKKKIFNDNVMQYILTDGHIHLSALDSFGKIIPKTGSMDFLIIFQDSLGNKVMSKRFRIKGARFDKLKIRQDTIRAFIQRRFELQ